MAWKSLLLVMRNYLQSKYPLTSPHPTSSLTYMISPRTQAQVRKLHQQAQARRLHQRAQVRKLHRQPHITLQPRRGRAPVLARLPALQNRQVFCGWIAEIGDGSGEAKMEIKNASQYCLRQLESIPSSHRVCCLAFNVYQHQYPGFWHSCKSLTSFDIILSSSSLSTSNVSTIFLCGFCKASRARFDAISPQFAVGLPRCGVPRKTMTLVRWRIDSNRRIAYKQVKTSCRRIEQ